MIYTILGLYYSKKYGQKSNGFNPVQIISILVLILIIMIL